jgi:peptide/nickel transport system substrate-binding protein
MTGSRSQPKRWSPVLAALAIAVTACAPAQAPGSSTQPQSQQAGPPKRIVAAVNSIPVALNNMIGAATGSQPGMEALGVMVNSGFTIVDNRGNITPQLVEAVPTTENGLWRVFPDGRMEITWKIREGAVWHDGAPFTSADMLFTHQVATDAETLNVFAHRALRDIESISAPDARTVVTQWLRPYIYANLAYGYDGDRSLLPFPKHLLEQVFFDDKAGFMNLPFWTTGFVGTGPYKLKEWNEGTGVTFMANDRYVLGRPNIDEIEVKFIPDVSTLVANMLAGTVDVNLGRGLELEQAREILSRVEGAKTDNAVIGANAAYPQFMDTKPTILLNADLRRALIQAVDRQEMVDTFSFGQSTIAHTFIHDLESDYKDIEPSIVKYPYDPRRATELIEGLGYRKGPDGVFADGPGQRLSFEVRTSRGSERILAALASSWDRLGVAVDQVVVPPQLDRDVEYRATFPAFEIVRRGNYRWDLYRTLGSQEAPTAETRYNGGNRGRYQNADLDRLLRAYDATVPLHERTQVLGQIVNHVTDQVVVVGLYHGIDATVYAKRLSNVFGKYERTTQAWNIHQWTVD